MGGMVGLWGASSLVQSVQRGSISIVAASGSNTATITGVNMANSCLRYLGVSGNNAASSTAALATLLAFTNETTITATRTATGVEDVLVRFEVIEYRPGVIKSVQRGTISISSGGGAATATISGVDTGRTVVDFLGCRLDTSGYDNMFAWVVLTNATTVTATRFNTNPAVTIASYQAVEFF